MTSSVSSARPCSCGTLEQTGDDLVRVGDELHDGAELATGLGEDAVEFGDLVSGARVAVEQEAVGGVRLVQPVLHDRVGERVGHVAAGRHDRLDLQAQLRAFLDVGAEDVTGRDGGDAQRVGEDGRLRSLACSRRADDQQACAHRRSPS